jgi:glycosidase
MYCMSTSVIYAAVPAMALELMRTNADLGSVYFPGDSGGAVVFRLWAPLAKRAAVLWSVATPWLAHATLSPLDPEMRDGSNTGFFSAQVAGTCTGACYAYVLEIDGCAEALRIGDPCGRELVQDKDGPVVIWEDGVRRHYVDVVTDRPSWPLPGAPGAVAGGNVASRLPASHVAAPVRRHALSPGPSPEAAAAPGAIIAEVAIGGLLSGGGGGDCWAAATAALPYFCALGVTAIELMPVTAHNGDAWGYRPISQSHLHPSLGPRAAFRAFVEAAHAVGLAVLLDVVPNHMEAALLLAPDVAFLEAAATRAGVPPARLRKGYLAALTGHVHAGVTGCRSVSGGSPAASCLPLLSGRSYFYTDERFDTGFGGHRLDLSTPAVSDWLTRATLSWVVEAGIDGLRVDSIQTLVARRHRTSGRLDAVHAAAGNWLGGPLPEAVAWLGRLTAATRAALPGALLVSEDMSGREAALLDLGFHADWNRDVLCAVRGALGLPLRHPPALKPAPLAALAAVSVHPHAWSRCTYTGNHDENVVSTDRDRRERSVAALARGAAAAGSGRDVDRCALSTATLAHALLVLAIPGLPLMGPGQEALLGDSPAYPALLHAPAACRPPGSPGFASFVAHGVMNRLRRAFPAFEGVANAHHLNDSSRLGDRVYGVVRQHHVGHVGGAACGPILVVCNLTEKDYPAGYVVGVPAPHGAGDAAAWRCAFDLAALNAALLGINGGVEARGTQQQYLGLASALVNEALTAGARVSAIVPGPALPETPPKAQAIAREALAASYVAVLDAPAREQRHEPRDGFPHSLVIPHLRAMTCVAYYCAYAQS